MVQFEQYPVGPATPVTPVAPVASSGEGDVEAAEWTIAVIPANAQREVEFIEAEGGPFTHAEAVAALDRIAQRDDEVWHIPLADSIVLRVSAGELLVVSHGVYTGPETIRLLVARVV